MDCKKCGSPMYYPSPSKLCPQCEGEELDKWIAEQDAAQQSVQSDVCPSCGVDDWAYGDDTNTFEVCAMCGKRR